MNTTHTAGGDTQDLTKGMHQNNDKAMMACVCCQLSCVQLFAME